MTSDKPPDLPAPQETDASLVTRSAVDPGLPYTEYRQTLRYDFFHSCAYCTMSEAEATAIRFTIDHYEPRAAHPELVNEYSNLMYACDECNQRKGNRYPPSNARANGYRFFRPDEDAYSTHFELSGIRLEGKTNVGSYSIEAIDLNRLALRKLREIRRRLTECDKLVAEGVVALRKFHIDQLPPHVKRKVAGTIAKASAVASQMRDDIDNLLRKYARSPLIDPDPDGEARAKARSKKLSDLRILFPGTWRADKAAMALSRQGVASPSNRRQNKRSKT